MSRVLRTHTFILCACVAPVALTLFVGCDDGVVCETSDVCARGDRCLDGVCVSGEAHDAGATPDAGGGMDAAPPGRPDAGARDAGSETSRDTGVARDTGVDGDLDAGFDAGFDAGSDAGFDAGPVCDATLSPPGLRRVDLDYVVETGDPFGTSTSQSFLVELSETTFASIASFTMPTTPFRRRIIFEMTPTSHNQPDRSNRPTLSISECPGDFSASAACIWQTSPTGTFSISTRPADVGMSRFCHLEPGRTYYLNFVGSDMPFTRAPTCTDSPSYDSRRCAIFFTEATL